MKKYIFAILLVFLPFHAKADFWGADLPMLAEIVFNTLHTMVELQKQTNYMESEFAGIDDRIVRIRTISEMVEPTSWDKWKDPAEASRRLKTIYQTMPKEYRNEKDSELENELAQSMNLVSKLEPETRTSFNSGKELERRGADASPAVAQKLSASGIGSLIAVESQSQALQSHITSLLAQMMAQANEKETRAVISRGTSFKSFASSLKQSSYSFSQIVLSAKAVSY